MRLHCCNGIDSLWCVDLWSLNPEKNAHIVLLDMRHWIRYWTKQSALQNRLFVTHISREKISNQENLQNEPETPPEPFVISLELCLWAAEMLARDNYCSTTVTATLLWTSVVSDATLTSLWNISISKSFNTLVAIQVSPSAEGGVKEKK